MLIDTEKLKRTGNIVLVDSLNEIGAEIVSKSTFNEEINKKLKEFNNSNLQIQNAIKSLYNDSIDIFELLKTELELQYVSDKESEIISLKEEVMFLKNELKKYKTNDYDRYGINYDTNYEYILSKIEVAKQQNASGISIKKNELLYTTYLKLLSKNIKVELVYGGGILITWFKIA